MLAWQCLLICIKHKVAEADGNVIVFVILSCHSFTRWKVKGSSKLFVCIELVLTRFNCQMDGQDTNVLAVFLLFFKGLFFWFCQCRTVSCGIRQLQLSVWNAAPLGSLLRRISTLTSDGFWWEFSPHSVLFSSFKKPTQFSINVRSYKSVKVSYFQIQTAS